MNKENSPSDMNPSETVIAFVAWLSARPEETVFGLKHHPKKAVELAANFCQSNGLDAPRHGHAIVIKIPDHTDSVEVNLYKGLVNMELVDEAAGGCSLCQCEVTPAHLGEWDDELKGWFCQECTNFIPKEAVLPTMLREAREGQ